MDPGIFEMKNVEHLFQKLEFDRDQLREKPDNSYRCFNFFVTAEHMYEWWNKGTPEGKTVFYEKNPILKVCCHIANGAKHFIALDKRYRSVASTAYSESTYYDPNGNIHRNGQAFLVKVEDLGLARKEYLVTDLADEILEFWRVKLHL